MVINVCNLESASPGHFRGLSSAECQIWLPPPADASVGEIQVLLSNALGLMAFASDFRDHVNHSR